jgi:hypothetical protein
MVETFAGRPQPWIQERVLKTCCIRPNVVDPSELNIDQLSARLEGGSVHEAFRPWFCIACAMASLRKGDGDQAIHWADRARDAEQASSTHQALSLVIAALAKQQRGLTDEARSSLAAAQWLIDENLPQRDEGVDPHFSMRGQALRIDWLFAEFLRREAEQQLVVSDGADISLAAP